MDVISEVNNRTKVVEEMEMLEMVCNNSRDCLHWSRCS